MFKAIAERIYATSGRFRAHQDEVRAALRPPVIADAAPPPVPDDQFHPGELITVPDVRGQAIRRAVARLSLAHLDVGIQGSGVVVAQSPSPHEHVRAGTHVVIRCEQRNLSLVTAD